MYNREGPVGKTPAEKAVDPPRQEIAGHTAERAEPRDKKDNLHRSASFRQWPDTKSQSNDYVVGFIRVSSTYLQCTPSSPLPRRLVLILIATRYESLLMQISNLRNIIQQIFSSGERQRPARTR